MSFEPTFLFIDIILGLVGGSLFWYGWKQQRMPQLAAGLLLSIYPYFVSTLTELLVIAALIVAGLWWVLRAGY